MKPDCADCPLLHEIRKLTLLLHARNRTRTHQPPAEIVEALLRAIRAARADAIFGTKELIEGAAPGLQAAIAAAVGKVEPASLGRLLRRIAGQEHGGLVVRRVDKEERTGALWQIVIVDEIHGTTATA